MQRHILDTSALVFANEDFLILNKPAGLNFHSEESPGLVVLAQALWSETELYPVHRLDKMTSGLVILAKSKVMAQAFQQLFAERQLDKYYVALSDHKPKKKQGWIKGDMQPARRGSWKLAKTQQNPAITQFISASLAPGERAFLLKLHTGKTHQIRVALKSLGAPIVGDPRYEQAELAKQADRGYLHAYGLRFHLNGQDYAFVCPPTEGARFHGMALERLLLDWQQPWQLFK